MATKQALLSLVDVRGVLLQEACLIRLRNLSSSVVRQVRSTAGKWIQITGLKGRPQSLHQIQVDPTGSLTSSLFVDVQASGPTEATVVCAVDRGRAGAVSFPKFSELPAQARTLMDNSANVRGVSGKHGEGLYDALDDVRRAGLLSIIAKTSVTSAKPAETVLSQRGELTGLRGDRCFCVVPQSLRDDTKNAAVGGGKVVSGSMAHVEPDYSEAGSFKTPLHSGNLQLTFVASPSRWTAGIDVDDAGGLGHMCRVVRNEVSGSPTHRYDIHQIAVRHQSLDPMYRLRVRA